MYTAGKQVLESTLLIEDVDPLPDNQVGLAVLGSPIEHSISPQIHGSALKELSIVDPQFLNWNYVKIQVESSDLASALPHLAKCGYLGLNLTIPHKVDVLPLLESVDEEARNIGAVNTLFYDCAKWNGFNSDGYGLEKALIESLDISLNSAKVLILGAGGAARAAAAQALSRQCNQIWMANRSLSRLKILEGKLGETFDLSGFSTFELSKIPAELFKVEDLVIINATSLGLNKSDPQPISLSGFHSTTKVYDMIYNPARTGLLAEAVNLGMPCDNGLSMLVHQAARSLSIWTKQDISSTTMFLSAKLALKQ